VKINSTLNILENQSATHVEETSARITRPENSIKRAAMRSPETVNGNNQSVVNVNVNFEKLSAIMVNMGRILKTESKIEMVVNLLDEISKQYGIKKATFYAVNQNYDRVFRRCSVKERNKFIHKVPFHDEVDGQSYNLLAIAKSKEDLCT